MENLVYPQREEIQLTLSFITAITMKSGVVECNSVVECLLEILEALGLILSTVHMHTYGTHMNINLYICSFREVMLETFRKRTMDCVFLR